MMLLQSDWTEAAEASVELEGVHVHWRSENKSADQLALAIEKLYVVLYNTGNLPTRQIVDSKGPC